MSYTNTEGPRALYRDAFAEWALRIGRLQVVMGSGAGEPAVSNAQARAAVAEAAYRDSRDRLCDIMISEGVKQTV